MKIEKVSSWAELLASIAVVVTLVVLVFEVRSTNVALERQAAMDRAAALTAPFLDHPMLSDILAKIKAVDGSDQIPAAQFLEYNRYRQSFVDFVNQVEPLTRSGG